MWHSARIAVIVPAFREARLIGRTLAAMPEYVDDIWVVDDASDDGTFAAVTATRDARVHCIRHEENRGVGAAIVSGYRAALESGADVMAVMAGDAQMDPDDLARVVAPVVVGAGDYVKGNRFEHARAAEMPVLRRTAGRVLSFATRLATGLAVNDCQCGFTAISARAARELPLAELWPRFGYPNDLLGMLAARDFRVHEVPVRPIYADEASGVRPWHVLTVACLIARRYFIERSRNLAERTPELEAET